MTHHSGLDRQISGHEEHSARVIDSLARDDQVAVAERQSRPFALDIDPRLDPIAKSRRSCVINVQVRGNQGLWWGRWERHGVPQRDIATRCEYTTMNTPSCVAVLLSDAHPY